MTRIVRKDRLYMSLMQRIKALCRTLDGQATSFCMIDRIRGKDLLLVDKVR